MRECHTAILERHVEWGETFETDPYESGWASEALYFLYSTEPLPTDLTIRAQISADGRRWIDHGATSTIVAGERGGALPVEPNFGGWLRLVWTPVSTTAAPGAAVPELDIYLTLKQ